MTPTSSRSRIPPPDILGTVPLDLFEPFRPLSETAHRIGMETEFATLRRDSGLAAAYGGPKGTKRLLTTIAEAYGGTPIMGPQGPVGLELDDGSKITLEACGAFEYATAPADDLASVGAQM